MLGFLFRYYADLMKGIQLKYGKCYHRKALRKLRRKDTLRCVFFATFEETWKYDGVYQLMERHERFDPIILVCPIINYGYDNMIRRMDQCYSFFKDKGYAVQKGFDVSRRTYLDVKKELKPDLIFYTSPYEGLTDGRFFITQFKGVLTGYVPYFFNDTADFELAYDDYLHNVVWRRYLETEMHKEWAIRYSRNQGRNVVVTGYPGIEQLIANRVATGEDWKIKNNKLKRIIWAPHHSILPKDEYLSVFSLPHTFSSLFLNNG